MGRMTTYAVVSETTGKVLGRYLEDKVVGCLKKFRNLSYAAVRDNEVITTDTVFLSSAQKYIKPLTDVNNTKYCIDGRDFRHEQEIVMVLQSWEVEPVTPEPLN